MSQFSSDPAPDLRQGTQAPRPGAPTADAPWPVALVSSKIRDYIDNLGSIWVEGEITQWNERGGNVFGKLKDLEQDATLSFTIWSSTRGRQPADLKQGDRVAAYMKPNFWVKGGTFTMIVSQIRHVGLGDLLERLERLKRQLASEGLFDASRKRRLPFLPNMIGLITGANSDAEKDVLRNARLRWPEVRFRTIHTAVQGPRVPEEVVAAIHELDADPEVDVIIIARGGGDFQHLLGFSDEGVVRAAAAAQTPVVSAIGHENDRPLLDEVADLRASTPTDAAKRVVPDIAEERARVADARGRLATRLMQIIRTEQQHLDQLRSRPALASPSWIIDQRAEDIARLADRGNELLTRMLERAAGRVGELRAGLVALSPQATLDRGYAVARTPSGRVLTSPDQAPEGSEVSVLLARGELRATSRGPLPDAPATH